MPRYIPDTNHIIPISTIPMSTIPISKMNRNDHTRTDELASLADSIKDLAFTNLDLVKSHVFSLLKSLQQRN